MEQETKFCKHCGAQIPADAVICIKCGRQVETVAQEQPKVVINNTNANSNVNTNIVGGGKPKNKWVAFFLCLFLGPLGIHKFYEGKIGMGILYLLTAGICSIGWLIDIFVILFKPNPYYV